VRALICLLLLSLLGCDGERLLAPQMEKKAIKTVEAYLNKYNLPLEELKPFQSSASSKPDFSFLYTGGGRCIEFIVYCYGNECTELKSYPYYEHGDKCPVDDSLNKLK
jgi:hypothetical protein